MSDQPTHDVGPVHGGARWCEQHGRWECTKQRKAGRGECHSIALTGTDKCRMHAGERSDVVKARAMAITAWSAIGGDPTVEPGRIILSLLQMSWLRLHLYAQLLAAQADAEGWEPDNVDDEGDEVEFAVAGSTGGLIGHTFAPSKEGGRVVTGEAVRGLVLLEAQERDRCAKLAKTAHDMGIAEREVRLAEQQGELLAGVIKRVLGDLDLTVEQQQRVPAVVGQHLRAVAELEAGGAA
ncbi:hypothetical protein [Kribbella deserti]|uniref:DUF222 domain-containing protein n=1 Tax=Kribbella deserti TaxID=1926257 RepID=A0ABV6QPP8_9ACTN